MRLKLLTLLTFMLLLASAVSAVPPTDIQVNVGTGLEIVNPKFDYFCQAQDFTMQFHIYNSTGYLVDPNNVDCIFHLYNNSGNHLIDGGTVVDGNNVDMYVAVNSSNINGLGHYSYTLHCNDTQEAGLLSAGFEVTRDCKAPAESDSTALAITLFLLLITGGFLLLPFAVKEFSADEVYDMVARRACYTIGLFLLALNAGIMMDFSNRAGIGINSELFMFVWLFMWAGYIMAAVMMIKSVADILRIHWMSKQKERFG